MHEGRVQNEHDRRAQLFSWTPNQEKEQCDLRQSSQVYKRTYQEIWVRKCKD